MKLLSMLAACALLLGAATTRAEDTSDLEGLLEEPVVSTASMTAETSSTAPATSWTITAEELRRHGISSLDQAINFLSLGMIAENPMTAVEVGSRGVFLAHDYGSHVLLLVDGHALNEPWDGTAYFERGAAIPFELIDHIEVVLGPGSVLYGSHAMLGVINVVTKRAKDYAGYHAVLESEAPYSLRGALGVGQELELLGRAAELTMQVEYYGSRGPSLTYAPEPYGDDSVTGSPKRFSFGDSGTGIWGGVSSESPQTAVPSALARLKIGDFELNARAASYKRGAPHNWGAFDDPNNYERDRWLSGDLRWKRMLSSSLQVGARLYGDVYDYMQNAPSAAAEDCLEGQTGGCAYRLFGDAKWGGLELIGSYDWLADGRYTTLVGADGRLRRVGSSDEYWDPLAQEGTAGAPPYSYFEQALGAWIEQTARPLSWLGVNAGARLDFDDRFGTHLSPRLAVNGGLWEGGAVKAIYSEAFRTPTAFERYYADPMSFVAASELQPEVVRSVELGIEQRLGRQRLLLSLFRSWWSELVVYDELTEDEISAAIARGELDASVTEAWTYRNVSRIENYGLNLGLDGGVLGRRLRYGLGLTVAKAAMIEDEEESRLQGAAQVFGNARVSYDFGGSLPVLALAGRFAGTRPVVDSTFEDAEDAPAILELRASATGNVPRATGLSYRVSFDYNPTHRGPYAVGPVDSPVEGYTEQQLNPQPEYMLLVGLQYTLR